MTRPAPSSLRAALSPCGSMRALFCAFHALAVDDAVCRAGLAANLLAAGHIERMMHGEKNVTWAGEIKWFAKSSGTTADKSKFIPVSEESLEDSHYKAATDVLTMYYNFNPESGLLTGNSPGCWVGGCLAPVCWAGGWVPGCWGAAAGAAVTLSVVLAV